MSDWETVREIACGLPSAEESTTYGQPAFKVGGKLFAWLSPDRPAAGAIAVRVDPGEKVAPPRLRRCVLPDTALRRPPDHARRLDRATRDQLEGRIEDSWLLRAPKRLTDAYVAARG